MRPATASTTAAPPPPGMCTSTSTTSGCASRDRGDGALDVGGLAHDLERLAHLGAHAGQEQAVVVHDEDPDRRRSCRSRSAVRGQSELDLGALAGGERDLRRAAVSAGAARRIESRDAAAVLRHVSGSNPFPWSRTKAVTESGSTSTYSDTRRRARVLGRVVSASPHGAHDGLEAGVQRRVADDHDSTGCRCASSISLGERRPRAALSRSPPSAVPAAGTASAQLPLLPAGQRGHARGSSAERWMSASVCSTESCRCAATSCALLGADAFAALLGQLGARAA